jgi:hypothetical protein
MRASLAATISSFLFLCFFLFALAAFQFALLALGVALWVLRNRASQSLAPIIVRRSAVAAGAEGTEAVDERLDELRVEHAVAVAFVGRDQIGGVDGGDPGRAFRAQDGDRTDPGAGRRVDHDADVEVARGDVDEAAVGAGDLVPFEVPGGDAEAVGAWRGVHEMTAIIRIAEMRI